MPTVIDQKYPDVTSVLKPHSNIASRIRYTNKGIFE